MSDIIRNALQLRYPFNDRKVWLQHYHQGEEKCRESSSLAWYKLKINADGNEMITINEQLISSGAEVFKDEVTPTVNGGHQGGSSCRVEAIEQRIERYHLRVPTQQGVDSPPYLRWFWLEKNVLL